MASNPRHVTSINTDKAPNSALLLSEQVKTALQSYFVQLDGHSVSDLYAMVINEVEKPLIQVALEQAGHNQSKAAQILGLSRSTLRKKMAQFGLV